jgi:uncharacterized membrane protein
MKDLAAGLLYSLLVGLVGAAIVHIVIVMLVPVLSDRDAHAKLAAAALPFSVVRVSAGPEGLLAGGDPLFEAVACRFELSGAILHVRGASGLLFWTASVYDSGGRNLFSLNDRTAGEALDLVVAAPVQMIELRKALPPEFANSVLVESDSTDGFVVIRGFVPDASWQPIVIEALEALACDPVSQLSTTADLSSRGSAAAVVRMRFS